MSALDRAIATLTSLEERVPKRPGTVRRVGNTLLIDNPRARGALTVTMMRELGEHVRALREAPGDVVVLRGCEGAFCSGGHLGQVRAGLGTPDAGAMMCAAMTVVLDALAALPQVVVAEVDGPALGGGAELLTAADLRVFGDGARVGFVHGGLGVTPGWGATARLVRLLGAGKALEWMTGGIRQGGDLVELGTTRDRVDHLLALPEGSARALKRAVWMESPLTRTGGEATVFSEVWGAPLHRRLLGT